MTQDEINKVPPAPDPENYIPLEKDKTIVLFHATVGPSQIPIATITLREVVDGVARVQLTSLPQFQELLDMAGGIIAMKVFEPLLRKATTASDQGMAN